MPWFHIEKDPSVPFATFPTPLIDGRYTLVDLVGTPFNVERLEDIRVPVLGHGGFGAVVRVKDRIELPRALKLIDATGLLSVPASQHHLAFHTPGHVPSTVDAEAISERLREEIRHTNARPFKHIVPIIDYGSVTDRDARKVSYYVSPFIEGQTLGEFMGKLRKENPFGAIAGNRALRAQIHDVLLSLIDDLLSGLCELQDAGVSHIDIKPNNLMILPDPDGPAHSSVARDRLFIIDLGAAVSKRSVGGRIPLICTPYYFPSSLYPRLAYTAGRVDHAKLADNGATIDLYAVGRTLELVVCDRSYLPLPPEVLVEEAEKERYWRRVLDDDFEVVRRQIARLMTTDNAGFRHPADAQRAFQAIARRSSSNLMSSRILTDTKRGIKIQVGNTAIRLAPPFDRFVDHPVFQRLRRLQQLALLSQVFPDATHTRFAHSLTTFNLAKKFLLGLTRDTEFVLQFGPKEIEQVLASALLHDIGQYPFSHTIEDLRKLGTIANVPELSAIKHDQELAVDYLKRKEGNASLEELLTDSGYRVDDVVYMFQKKAKEPKLGPSLNIGRDLVSGVIDVDRVSYLQLDSARTGVPYGSALDVDELVESLRIYNDNGRDWSLAIDEGGLSAVEGILAAVYWMYRNVYWTPINRGFMAAIKHVMADLLQQKRITFDQYSEQTYARSDWEALELLSHEYDSLSKGSSDNWYSPIATLVAQRRFSYNRVFSLGQDRNNPDEDTFAQVMRAISPQFLDSWLEGIVSLLPRPTKVRRGEILLDVPLKPRLHRPRTDAALADTGAEAGTRPSLWVKQQRRFSERDSGWRTLADCSPMAESLEAIESHSGRKLRVFFSHELVDRLDATTTQRLQDIVERALIDVLPGSALQTTLPLAPKSS